MTIKKSLISVAAATLIVAGVAGCGGSSGSNSSGGTTSSSVTSSVTAVDGYIMNATATAVYFDEDNNSVSEPMKSSLHTTDSVDSTKDTVGAADYTMTDDTNKSLVRYFTLSNKLLETSGTTTTPATFIDDGSVTGVFDINDTVFATRFPGRTLYAPAGSSVLTPLTSAVFQQAGGTAAFTPATMGDLNQTVIDNAFDMIAAKTNISVSDLKTVDPTNDVSANPEYALINTLTAQAIDDGVLGAFVTALVAEDNATASTTLTETITKLETAATTAGLTTNVFTNVLADIAILGEANYIADIPSLNLDDTLNNGGTAAYSSALSTAVASTASVVAGGQSVWSLTSAGDKIGSTTGKDVTITFQAPEANTTGTADLLVQIAGMASFADETANSSEITIKVSDLNLSTVKTTTVALDETSDTKFSFGVQENNTSGVHYVSFSDANATAANIGDFITSSGLATTININTLLRAVDTNATGELGTSAGFDFTKISSIKVALVEGGKLQRVNATTTTQREAWGTTTVSSIADNSNSNLSGSGLTIFNLAQADSRANTTTNALNLAPSLGFSLSGLTGDTNSSTYDLNLTANTRYDLNVTTSSTDSSETNTTLAVTLGSGFTDKNVSAAISSIKDNLDANISGAIDANATTDTKTTIKFVATDEFGESNTTTYYALINVGASFSGKTESQDVAFNGTSSSTMTLAAINSLLNTGSIGILVSGLDDTNITVSENNTTGVVTLTDVNTSQDYNGTLTIEDPISGSVFTVDINNTH